MWEKLWETILINESLKEFIAPQRISSLIEKNITECETMKSPHEPPAGLSPPNESEITMEISPAYYGWASKI